jgi:hypothetical protein
LYTITFLGYFDQNMSADLLRSLGLDPSILVDPILGDEDDGGAEYEDGGGNGDDQKVPIPPPPKPSPPTKEEARRRGIPVLEPTPEDQQPPEVHIDFRSIESQVNSSEVVDYDNVEFDDEELNNDEDLLADLAAIQRGDALPVRASSPQKGPAAVAAATAMKQKASTSPAKSKPTVSVDEHLFPFLPLPFPFPFFARSIGS